MISPSKMKLMSDTELRNIEEQIDNERLRRKGDKDAVVKSMLEMAKGSETMTLTLGRMSRGRVEELQEMFGGESTRVKFFEDE